LLIDLHIALVFGSPLHEENLVFPGVLQSVFFFIGNMEAVPNEVPGKELDVGASPADDDPGVSGCHMQAGACLKTGLVIP
jgi:hypothetical protein